MSSLSPHPIRSLCFLRRAVVATYLILAAAPSWGGSNAGGQAFLSWDPAGNDTVLTSVPSGPFPLLLHLRSAPDVHALGVRIAWTTNTVDDPPCYSLVPSGPASPVPPPDSLRGWAFDAQPEQEFHGDTTYTWSISFEAGDQAKRCIGFLVSGASCCDTASAKFIAADVVVEDALGRLDTLAATGGARIVPEVVALALAQVSPSMVPLRQPSTLSIQGHGFESGSQVFLQRDGERLEATGVTVLDSTRLVAEVESTFPVGESVDLVVKRPGGREATLPSSLQTAVFASGQGSYSHPTNDALGHRQINLFSNRTASNLVDHITHPEWPSSLAGWLLPVRTGSIGPDSIAVILSAPYDGIGFELNSTVTFNLQPPQYATSLAFTAATGRSFNGPNSSFLDSHKSILNTTVTFEDNSTFQSMLKIGDQMRNWREGWLPCFQIGDSVRYYIVAPTDTIATQLYAGVGSGVPFQVFYDIQRLRLPEVARSKKVKSVGFQGQNVPHSCDFDGTSGIFGLTVWPEFTIGAPTGTRVSYLPQSTGATHGGYVSPYGLVGTRRTTNENACQVASLAMLYNFWGVSCSVNGLNAYLQTNRGYQQATVAHVDSVAPNKLTIYYSGPARDNPGKSWDAGKTFLVEHGLHHPVATFRIQTPGIATLDTWHDTADTVRSGDPLSTYWNLLADKAIGFANQTLQLHQSTAGDMAATVESLLVRGIPVNIQTHSKSTGHHFVVADGWVPAFRPGPSSRGTYTLKDPAYNIKRLADGHFKNDFNMIRYVEPVGGPGPNGASGTEAVTVGGPGLAISAIDADAITVTDPLGRSVFRDGSGSYVSNIPNALVLDNFSGDDDDDTANPATTITSVEIPSAVDGQYLVRVQAGGSTSLNTCAFDAGGAVDGDFSVDETVAAVYRHYRIAYSAATNTATILALGTTAVETPEILSGTSIRVIGSPARGSVQFAVARPSGVSDCLDIYDMAGRRIAAVPFTGGPAQVVLWNWHQTGCSPGVYFASLRSRAARTVRFVVLR